MSTKTESRLYSRGTYAPRYRSGIGGTGHALSVELTREMIRELLSAEGLSLREQKNHAKMLFEHMLTPPKKVARQMEGSVGGKFDMTPTELWRFMLRDYAEAQLGITLKHTGDTHEGWKLVEDIILTEALDPPDEIRLEMWREVEKVPFLNYMERWRAAVRCYAKLQWGLDLNGGDC